MSDIKNGDLPANPIRGANNTIFTSHDAGAIEGLGLLVGLTKRETFAMAAMQGILSNSGGVIQANPMSGTGWCNTNAESMAELSLECADALLLELSK